MRVLHFGVVPTGPADTPSIDGHDDPTTEHSLTVAGHTAYVSGSWACWGTADQDSDGDNTLHVAVTVDAPDDDLADLPGLIGDALSTRTGRGSRLLDYGIVSEDAWSEGQAVFLRDGGMLYAAVPGL